MNASSVLVSKAEQVVVPQEEEEEQKCPICCEALYSASTPSSSSSIPLPHADVGACVPCGHTFHVECARKWFHHHQEQGGDSSSPSRPRAEDSIISLTNNHSFSCPICNTPVQAFCKLFMDLNPILHRQVRLQQQIQRLVMEKNDLMLLLLQQEEQQQVSCAPTTTKNNNKSMMTFTTTETHQEAEDEDDEKEHEDYSPPLFLSMLYSTILDTTGWQALQYWVIATATSCLPSRSNSTRRHGRSCRRHSSSSSLSNMDPSLRPPRQQERIVPAWQRLAMLCVVSALILLAWRSATSLVWQGQGATCGAATTMNTCETTTTPTLWPGSFWWYPSDRVVMAPKRWIDNKDPNKMNRNDNDHSHHLLHPGVDTNFDGRQRQEAWTQRRRDGRPLWGRGRRRGGIARRALLSHSLDSLSPSLEIRSTKSTTPTTTTTRAEPRWIVWEWMVSSLYIDSIKKEPRMGMLFDPLGAVLLLV